MKTPITTTQEPTPVHEKLEQMLLLQNLSSRDLQILTAEEQTEMHKLLSNKMAELEKEQTRLMQLITQSANLPAKRVHWETNHSKIMRAIYLSLAQTGQMPNQKYISEVTGLSRQTIHKHMEEGADKSAFAEQLKHFNMMAPRVMGKIVKAAVVDEDMRAAKLYFEVAEKLNGEKAHLYGSSQQNSIQIGNTTLSQETLQRLSPEQLKQIEEIVKTAEAENKQNSSEEITATTLTNEVIQQPEEKEKEEITANDDSVKKQSVNTAKTTPDKEEIQKPDPVQQKQPQETLEEKRRKAAIVYLSPRDEAHQRMARAGLYRK